jgi:hypothetical protein
MEIKKIERNKTMKIDTKNNVVLLTYSVKILASIKNKDIEISESLTKQILIEYDTKYIAGIEHTMYELEREIEQYIENVKKFLNDLEFITENHGYEIN